MHKHCCTQLALEAHNITCRKFYARHVAADKMATAPNIVVAVPVVAVLAVLRNAIRDPNNSTSQDHIICHHRRRRRRRTLVIVCGPQLMPQRMPQCMQQSGRQAGWQPSMQFVRPKIAKEMAGKLWQLQLIKIPAYHFKLSI